MITFRVEGPFVIPVMKGAVGRLIDAGARSKFWDEYRHLAAEVGCYVSGVAVTHSTNESAAPPGSLCDAAGEGSPPTCSREGGGSAASRSPTTRSTMSVRWQQKHR